MGVRYGPDAGGGGMLGMCLVCGVLFGVILVLGLVGLFWLLLVVW